MRSNKQKKTRPVEQSRLITQGRETPMISCKFQGNLYEILNETHANLFAIIGGAKI